MSKSIARGLVGAGAILLAILLTGCSDEPSPTPLARAVATPTATAQPGVHAGADAYAHHGSDKHAHAGADACSSDLIPLRVPDSMRPARAGTGGCRHQW